MGRVIKQKVIMQKTGKFFAPTEKKTKEKTKNDKHLIKELRRIRPKMTTTSND